MLFKCFRFFTATAPPPFFCLTYLSPWPGLHNIFSPPNYTSAKRLKSHHFLREKNCFFYTVLASSLLNPLHHFCSTSLGSFLSTWDLLSHEKSQSWKIFKCRCRHVETYLAPLFKSSSPCGAAAAFQVYFCVFICTCILYFWICTYKLRPIWRYSTVPLCGEGAGGFQVAAPSGQTSRLLLADSIYCIV